MWKGKSRAVEQDFDDLNPVLTYRHLLSNSLGVRDPLRVIALCDNDAFYAACEMVRLRLDRSKPLIVLQWDLIIAVNYAAREFGISRLDKVNDAMKRCPQLLVVHVATYREGDPEPAYWDHPDQKTHKVSLDHYRRESAKINKMFKDCLPATAEIERASIDESFIDFTRPVRERLLQLFPHLAQVPSEGAETPLPLPPPIKWDGVGNLVPVNPVQEEQAEDGEDPGAVTFVKAPESQITWHDMALSIGAEMMQGAREQILTKSGYSTSAGIARNKFLAKLAASYKKPNSQTVLRNAAIPNYLRPIKFQKIRMLGGKLGTAIAQEYEVSTVAELLHISLDEIQHKFGEESIWVYEILRGIDRSEVKEKPEMTKSMLAAKNLPKPILLPSQRPGWIRVLAGELALRLRKARELSPNLWPKTISLKVQEGWKLSRSKQAPFPFVRNVTTDVVAAAGDKLWKELCDSTKGAVSITHVALAFGGIESGEANQQGIEGFLAKPESTGDRRKRKDDDDEAFESQGEGPSTDITSRDDVDSFICKRCKKRIKLPDSLKGPDVTDDAQQKSLKVLQMEHDDYHLAQDLSKAPEEISHTKYSGGSKRKKKKSEPDGIAKFFIKK